MSPSDSDGINWHRLFPLSPFVVSSLGLYIFEVVARIQLTDRKCSSNCLTTVPYLVAQAFDGLLLRSYHGVWIVSRCPLPSSTFFALTDAKDEFED
jgi:hypothetical protein